MSIVALVPVFVAVVVLGCLGLALFAYTRRNRTTYAGEEGRQRTQELAALETRFQREQQDLPPTHEQR